MAAVPKCCSGVTLRVASASPRSTAGRIRSRRARLLPARQRLNHVLLIDRPVAVKHDNTATGTQHDAFRAVGNINGCLVQFGGFHLAGDGPLPDQVVEPLLIVIEIVANVVRGPADIGRADSLVCLLCIGGGRLVDTRAVWQVTIASAGRSRRAPSQSFATQPDAVGSHIGDQASGLCADIHPFIELLRNLHCAAGGKAKLAGGFLLKGRCGEGGFGFSRIRFVWMSATDSPSASIAAAAAMASVSLPISSLPSFLPFRCVRRA